MSPTAIPIGTPTSLTNYIEDAKSSFVELGHGGHKSKKLIGQALKKRVENIDHDICEPGEEDTFFVGDLGEVYRQHMRWKMNLPRVKPFYGKPSRLVFETHANRTKRSSATLILK